MRKSNNYSLHPNLKIIQMSQSGKPGCSTERQLTYVPYSNRTLENGHGKLLGKVKRSMLPQQGRS